MYTQQSAGWISYAVPLVIIALVMALRWRRMSQVRPLKLERLWVLPALYALVAIGTFAATPPHGLAWLFCAAALVLGAALGWQRGKMMRIAIDPATHTLNQTASPAAFLFIVMLVVARSGARAALTPDNALHLNAVAVTDMLIALALGLFTMQRLEMYLRGRRMLAGVART